MCVKWKIVDSSVAEPFFFFYFFFLETDPAGQNETYPDPKHWLRCISFRTITYRYSAEPTYAVTDGIAAVPAGVQGQTNR